EVEGVAGLCRVQRPRVCRLLRPHLERPVIEPDTQRRCLRAGQAEGFAGELLLEAKAPAGEIGDGEMRDIDLAGTPGGCGRCRCRGRRGPPRRCRRQQRDAEKCQLEAEALSVGGVEIARQIPPLLTELRVWSMIAGKLEGARR